MRLRALLRPLSSSALTRRALDACNSIFDIFFNFRTAIYAADGSLVLDTTKVRKSYMRGWFGLDVLACLPVTYVEMVANHIRGDDGNPQARSSLYPPVSNSTFKGHIPLKAPLTSK